MRALARTFTSNGAAWEIDALGSTHCNHVALSERMVKRFSPSHAAAAAQGVWLLGKESAVGRLASPWLSMDVPWPRLLVSSYGGGLLAGGRPGRNSNSPGIQAPKRQSA